MPNYRANDPLAGGAAPANYRSSDPLARSGGTASAAPQKSGGILGGIGHFASNLGSDIKNTIENIPTGVANTVGAVGHDIAKATAEHPWLAATNPASGIALGVEQLTGKPKGGYETPGVAKGIAKSYATTYGPLVHGNVKGFLHELEMHPLGPILDAAAVATLGAGGVAKAGSILAKAGAISDASRFAKLGEATDLTTPGFNGENVVVKQSSRNPLVRLRQQSINNALNRLPLNTPGVGSAARATKALMRTSEREGARLDLQGADFRQAFNKLNPTERLAWHLKSRAVAPGEYQALVKSQGTKGSQSMLKQLADPKLAKVFATPTPKLQRALDLGRVLADRMTELKVAGGHLDEHTAIARQYNTAALARGVEAKTPEQIESLAQQLHAAGHEQPFYVPDKAVVNSLRTPYAKRASGFNAPDMKLKQNTGVLIKRGLISPNENALHREWVGFSRKAQAQLLHDELVKHAAVLEPGEPVPVGYEELKLNRGQSTPYTAQIGGKLEHENATPEGARATANHFFAPLKGAKGEAPEVATKAQRLIVPSEARRIVEDNTKSYNSRLARLAYHAPTSAWKNLVLGLRPAFFTNITAGNSILGALQMAPGRFGVAGWLNQVLPGAEHILGSKLSEETMRDVLPEQAYGTFGHSVEGAGHGRLASSANRAARVFNTARQGVMPATIGYENVLRRAMAEGWAKSMPEVRAAMKRNGGDVNAALREVAKTKPQVINNISRRIDDALGNYRTYNRLERAIKNVVPFYGWNRHIVRSAARLALERPATLDALYNEGLQGKALNDRLLGALPSNYTGSIRLPGLPRFIGSGGTPVLQTHSLNPFNTIVDTAELLGLPLNSHPGAIDATLPINPIIQALLEQYTGRSLLTGGKVKGNAVQRFVENLPQAGLISGAHYGKVSHSTPSIRLANYLGLPVKELDLAAAHTAATKKRNS